MSKPITCVMLLAVSLLLASSTLAEDQKGQADLDQATELRLSAKSLRDLEKIAQLCESAIGKGLDDTNEKFSRELLAATLYEHSSRVAGAILNAERPNPRWQLLRHIALRNLEKSLTYNDKLGEAHVLLCRLHQLPGGDRKRALRSADSAAEIYKEDKEKLSDVLVLRASLSDDIKKRMADLDEAIKQNANNSTAWEAKARLLFSQGEFEKAAEGYAKLLEKDKKNVTARLAFAEALTSMKKFDKALEQIDKAIELNPKSPNSYTLRARLHALQDDAKAALADLDKALEIAPDDIAALLVRGELLLIESRHNDARADVEAALQARPGLIMGYMLRSRISAAEGEEAKKKKKETLSRVKFAAAKKDILLLLKNDPDNMEMALQMATLTSADGQPRKAIKLIDRLLKKGDDNWRGLRSRADIYLSIGEHKKAVNDYQKALKIQPDHSGILNNLAWVLATSPKDDVRDGKRSLELALKACKVSEYKEAYILSTLASSYAETGDFENAVKWSSKAVELGAENLKEQLQKELDSYNQKKPWRELQETDENEDFSAPGGDVVET